jgi:hypothetical protein
MVNTARPYMRGTTGKPAAVATLCRKRAGDGWPESHKQRRRAGKSNQRWSAGVHVYGFSGAEVRQRDKQGSCNDRRVSKLDQAFSVGSSCLRSDEHGKATTAINPEYEVHGYSCESVQLARLVLRELQR